MVLCCLSRNDVAMWRQAGATVSDPATAPSAFTGAILANITTPTAVRIELAEIGPDTALKKAPDSWK